MKTLLYAYRHKESGVLQIRGNFPYKSKSAATSAALRAHQRVKRSDEEMQAQYVKTGWYPYRYRQTTVDERQEILARDYELVTYELREVA